MTLPQTDRKLALALGFKTYVGRPCKHGHIGTRRTDNRTCVDCGRVWAKRCKHGYRAITARQAAMACGEIHYEGRPCKHGHTKRSTKSRQCVVCHREASRGRSRSNYQPEYRRMYNAYYRRTHRDKIRQADQRYRTRHAVKLAEKQRHRAAINRTTLILEHYPEYYRDGSSTV